MKEQIAGQPGHLLSDDLRMDAVTLSVRDMGLMSDYYANSLGLQPLEEKESDGQVRRVLGRGSTPLVRLDLRPDLPQSRQTEAGLFHTAFLFENRAALSAAVYQTARTKGNRFAGSSDHLVSEAFYFTDPEGNGIELYWDRPRDLWEVDRNGHIQMSTLYLDPNEYLQSHLTETAVENLGADPVGVGHVHLQVGDLRSARRFYVDALGFDVTADNYPGALFTSAGGYHHHLAMNTWNSRGAGPRASTLGLGDVAITLSSRDDLDELAQRLRRLGVHHLDRGNSIVTNDPWGTQITVSLPTGTVDALLER